VRRCETEGLYERREVVLVVAVRAWHGAVVAASVAATVVADHAELAPSSRGRSSSTTSRQTIESTSGPFSTVLAYRLSAQGGGTLVAFSVTGRPTGLPRLLEPLLARNAQRNLDRGSPRLNRFLETGTAG
jgi:hypothetical protein